MQGSKWVLAASLLSAVPLKLLSDAGAMQLLCGNLWNLVGEVDGEADRSWRDGKYWRDNQVRQPRKPDSSPNKAASSKISTGEGNLTTNGLGKELRIREGEQRITYSV